MSATAEVTKVQIQAGADGILRPRDIDEGFRLAQAYLVSGLLPERYKTAAMILAAMQYAYELGLKPMTALRQMASIHGTNCIFGDLPLGVVLASGRMESIKEVWLDKDMKEICLANKNLSAPVFAALCIVKRKGDPEPLEAFFTMTEADAAGLTKVGSKGPGVWQKFPKRMLRYRARSQALKDKFPDCLNGIAIAEYDFNTIEEDLTNVTPPAAPQNAEPAKASEGPTAVEPYGKLPLSEKLKRKLDFAEVIDAETE